MPRYRTSKGREFVLAQLTPDEYADLLALKLEKIREAERQGELGVSKIITKGMPALPQDEIDEREKSWQKYAAERVAEVRYAVEVSK